MTNPYAPPPPESRETVPPALVGRNACPLCGHRVSRWTIINALNRYRCPDCKAVLEVQVPRVAELLWIASVLVLLAASLFLSAVRPGSEPFYVWLAVIGGSFAILAIPFRFLVGFIVAKP